VISVHSFDNKSKNKEVKIYVTMLYNPPLMFVRIFKRSRRVSFSMWKRMKRIAKGKVARWVVGMEGG
jgi:hypothetical protein